MNSKYMGSGYERRDEERKELKREMEETKSIKVAMECKRKLLLLDREEVLEEQERIETKMTTLKDTALELVIELEEIDRALKQFEKEV